MGEHRLKDATGMMRGHYADDDVGVTQGIFEAVRRGDNGGDGSTGEKEIVDVARIDALFDFGFVGPQAYLMRSLATQHNCDGRAPSSRANYCDLAHKKPS